VEEYITSWCECMVSGKITPILAALISTCNRTPAKNPGFLGGSTPVIP
jgi:hypothetical protein